MQTSLKKQENAVKRMQNAAKNTILLLPDGLNIGVRKKPSVH
jgi:hypothetical protein